MAAEVKAVRPIQQVQVVVLLQLPVDLELQPADETRPANLARLPQSVQGNIRTTQDLQHLGLKNHKLKTRLRTGFFFL